MTGLIQPKLYLLQAHPVGAEAAHDEAAADAETLHGADVTTEHGVPAEHTEPPKEWWQLANEWNVVSFLIVFAFLAFMFQKYKVFSGFDRSRERILGEISQLEDQKRKALADLDAVRSRTSNLSQEVDAVMASARDSAETLSVQILKDAQEQAEKIIESSKKRIDLEQKAAAKDLQRRLLQDALNDARVHLAENLSKDEQKQSVASFIEALAERKV